MFFVNREVVPLLYVVGAPTSARGVYNENFYAGFVCSCMIPDWPNFQNAKCRLVVLVLVQFEKKDRLSFRHLLFGELRNYHSQ
jgi:hypothetical protein